jgi:KipI family sensor histidine kinase inhibitor
VVITRVGAAAVLVEVDDAVAALSLATWLRGRVRAEEVVPAARTVLVDGLAEDDGVASAVAAWPGVQATQPGPEVTVPVRYDGPDLAAVADHWACSPGDVVARHCATSFVSAFCGFSPGFAYLVGLPRELAVPRLASPRARLEPGSVALADTWCGIYPTASPGGWRVIGHTDVVLWDAGTDPPALLAPGVRVRFEVAP